MRTQKRFLVSGLAVLAGLAMIISGCSDSTTPSTKSGPTTGSLDDPEFVAVQTQIDALTDSTVTFFLHGLNALQGIGATSLPPQYTVEPGGTEQVETEYQNGWHIIGLNSLVTGNSFYVRDSVQFLKNGNPQQTPAGTQQMTFIHRWHQSYLDTELQDTADGRAQFSFGDLYTTGTDISGTSTLSSYHRWTHVDSVITRTFDGDMTVSGFVIDQQDGQWLNGFQNPCHCPGEGAITADISMSYKKDNNTVVNTNWDVTVEFEDGEASVSVSSNNVEWSYTRQVCTVI